MQCHSNIHCASQTYTYSFAVMQHMKCRGYQIGAWGVLLSLFAPHLSRPNL